MQTDPDKSFLSKKILFACMDWGLGHASRSIPVIKKLVSENHKVTLASAGQALFFLKNYFPDLTVLEKPSYNIRYSKNFSVSLMLLFQSSKFLKTIKEEKKWLDRIMNVYHFDEIFSDNCYGVYHTNALSNIITHQLMVKCPKGLGFLESSLHNYILRLTNKFDQCLIPDYENGKNLSGDLSHKYTLPPNASFIGPLSRFEKKDKKEYVYDHVYEYAAILSGPEPLRSEFEKYCVELFKNSNKKCLIVRGLPGENKILNDDKIEFHNHLNDEEFRKKILSSEKIICRSGYSTIMDLHVLNKKAIFIPTPGQTEQEYLAKLHS